MLETEVTPTLKAFAARLDVVAIHHHMTNQAGHNLSALLVEDRRISGDWIKSLGSTN